MSCCYCFFLIDKEFKLQAHMFEYLHAFKLLCANEGWSWTLKTFLKEYIIRILDELTHISLSSSESQENQSKSKRLLAFYFYVQGNIISFMCPKEDLNTHGKEAIKSLGYLLQNSREQNEGKNND